MFEFIERTRTHFIDRFEEQPFQSLCQGLLLDLFASIFWSVGVFLLPTFLLARSSPAAFGIYWSAVGFVVMLSLPYPLILTVCRWRILNQRVSGSKLFEILWGTASALFLCFLTNLFLVVVAWRFLASTSQFLVCGILFVLAMFLFYLGSFGTIAMFAAYAPQIELLVALVFCAVILIGEVVIIALQWEVTPVAVLTVTLLGYLLSTLSLIGTSWITGMMKYGEVSTQPTVEESFANLHHQTRWWIVIGIFMLILLTSLPERLFQFLSCLTVLSNGLSAPTMHFLFLPAGYLLQYRAAFGLFFAEGIFGWFLSIYIFQRYLHQKGFLTDYAYLRNRLYYYLMLYARILVVVLVLPLILEPVLMLLFSFPFLQTLQGWMFWLTPFPAAFVGMSLQTAPNFAWLMIASILLAPLMSLTTCLLLTDLSFSPPWLMYILRRMVRELILLFVSFTFIVLILIVLVRQQTGAHSLYGVYYLAIAFGVFFGILMVAKVFVITRRQQECVTAETYDLAIEPVLSSSGQLPPQQYNILMFLRTVNEQTIGYVQELQGYLFYLILLLIFINLPTSWLESILFTLIYLMPIFVRVFLSPVQPNSYLDEPAQTTRATDH